MINIQLSQAYCLVVYGDEVCETVHSLNNKVKHEFLFYQKKYQASKIAVVTPVP